MHVTTGASIHPSAAYASFLVEAGASRCVLSDLYLASGMRVNGESYSRVGAPPAALPWVLRVAQQAPLGWDTGGVAPDLWVGSGLICFWIARDGFREGHGGRGCARRD